MSEIELLPCPFCGEAAEFSKGKTGDGKDWRYIECGSCEAMGPRAEYADHNIAVKEALVAAWNRRTDLSQADVAAALEAAWIATRNVICSQDWTDCDGDVFCDTIAATIRALITPAQHDALAAHVAAEVAKARAVKPLEWLQIVDGRKGSFLRRKWEAQSDFGVTYEIWDYDHVLFDTGLPAPWHNPPPDDAVRYCLNMDGRSRILQQYHPTLEAAQAAAQADYDERILSALAPFAGKGE